MDWTKAIQYAQLVNAAYDVLRRESTCYAWLRCGRYHLCQRFGNGPESGRGNVRVKIGLVLQAQDRGEAVVAIRGTEGIKEWVQDAQFLDEAFTFVAGARAFGRRIHRHV